MTDELVPVPDIPLTSVREGVEVEPAPCGNCGEMTISRIESPDGKIGCLKCLMGFIGSRDPVPRLPVSSVTEACWQEVCKEIRVFEDNLKK